MVKVWQRKMRQSGNFLIRLTPSIMPTNVGPTEQPISPASASIANKAVPPPFMADEALLKVPGHRIPTEN